METKQNFPDIYVISKFADLPRDLRKYLPESVKVIPVQLPGLQMNKYKIIEVSQSTLELLQGAEVLVIDNHCLAYLLYKLPNVKWVQNTLVGVEIAMDALDPSKPLPSFTLTRCVDSHFGDLMANYVLAQIINVERNFFEYHVKQKLKIWDRPHVLPNLRTLKDITIGILGAGAIGSAIGNLLKKAGSRVIVFVRNRRSGQSDSFDGAFIDLSVILEKSDYVCNVLPSTKNTRGLLDNDMLQNCKKKPVFINVGRGDVIRNSSLIKALREGWISRAILDVMEEEPLTSDSELWDMTQVHITPHIGGIPKCDGVAKFIAENYLKYVKGEQLLNVVSWENGY